MEKEMTASRARAIAEGARQALFDAVKEAGFPLEVGQVNADGHVLTEEDVEHLSQVIDEAGLRAISGTYTIIEDEHV